MLCMGIVTQSKNLWVGGYDGGVIGPEIEIQIMSCKISP